MTARQIIAHNIFKLGRGYVSMKDAWEASKESIWINHPPEKLTIL